MNHMKILKFQLILFNIFFSCHALAEQKIDWFSFGSQLHNVRSCQFPQTSKEFGEAYFKIKKTDSIYQSAFIKGYNNFKSIKQNCSPDKISEIRNQISIAYNILEIEDFKYFVPNNTNIIPNKPSFTELSIINYEGYYNYDIACKNPVFRNDSPHLCDKDFTIKSNFIYDGLRISGKFEAEDVNADTFSGNYKFEDFSKNNATYKAVGIWSDKHGEGRLELVSEDDWKTFNGKWYFNDNGKQIIKGYWSASYKYSDDLNASPFMNCVFIKFIISIKHSNFCRHPKSKFLLSPSPVPIQMISKAS